jgi:DNA-binding transcriptional LysR family regulator
MESLDWNDVRYLLAAVRTGSTLAASRALKVSQPTVARRIAALEAALGVPLVLRSQTGYRPTPQAESLMARFEAVETAVERLSSAALAEARQTSSRVRISTNDLYANQGVAAAVAEFRARHPGIQVELVVTDRLVDLAAGEADVAIRAAGRRPNEAGLVFRSLSRSRVAVFGSQAYFDRRGRPETIEALDGHAFITIGGNFADTVDVWLAAHAPNARVEVRTSSMLALVSQVRAGAALAFLPADDISAGSDLIACVEAPGYSLETWLVTHERVRHAPNVRAFMDFAAAFHRDGRRLTRLA